MKKAILFSALLYFSISNWALSQYELSEAQITNGFYYLRDNAGFKNRSSVQYNGHTVSKKKFERECFTWVRYDISAQNGFGGYGREDYNVYFYGGQPIHIESSKGVYYMFANSDKVADEIINWAKAVGSFKGECAIEIERQKLEEQNRIRIENEKREEENRKREADKAITNKIIENIKNDKLEEALKEFNSLSFPDEFPSDYKKILDDKQDAINLKKINEHLSSKQPDEAAKTYNFLNTKNADLKSNIQNALNQKYQNDTASLNTRILEQLIELNKDKLTDLKAGKHTLLVSPEGKLSIIGNQSLLLNQPQRNVAESKEIEGFNVIRLPSKAILNIDIKKTMLEHKDIFVSTNKIIKQKRNGVLYKVNYLNNSIYHEDVRVTYSSDVPKGKYWITQDALTKFYVNGSETIEKKTKDKIEEGKFSKRIPTIITKTTIFTSGLFWCTLRTIEFLRIP